VKKNFAIRREKGLGKEGGNIPRLKRNACKERASLCHCLLWVQTVLKGKNSLGQPSRCVSKREKCERVGHGPWGVCASGGFVRKNSSVWTSTIRYFQCPEKESEDRSLIGGRLRNRRGVFRRRISELRGKKRRGHRFM